MDRRIADLERLLGTSEAPPAEDLAEVARRRGEFNAKWERAREEATREERAGSPARRIALEDLEERIKERIRARRPSS